MGQRAVIFSNGNLSKCGNLKTIIRKNDFIIAADGAAAIVFKLGLIPHLVIGDFDSVDQKTRMRLEEKKMEMVTYPTRKDKTDFELAIDTALHRGFSEIIIFGLWGDRIDHLLANINLLAKIKKEQINLKIIEEDREIYILNNKLTIEGNPGDLVSIIPLAGDAEGIVTSGLDYPLHSETLPFGTTRGVSNVMKEKKATIILKKGKALVVHYKIKQSC